MQTDADANEQQAITVHRLETGAADLIGGCGGPIHHAGFEITPDGEVGPIGGIPQKLLGAREKGATVFLTPGGNCIEALRSVPAGLRLVRVDTLADAVEGLRQLRDGGTARGCEPVASAAP